MPELDELTEEQKAELFKEFAKKQERKPSEEEVVFAEIEENNDLIRVYRGAYKGKEQLSVRKFYWDDEQWKFGKGVTFKYDSLDEIMAGLQAMKDWCDEHSREGD